MNRIKETKRAAGHPILPIIYRLPPKKALPGEQGFFMSRCSRLTDTSFKMFQSSSALRRKQSLSWPPIRRQIPADAENIVKRVLSRRFKPGHPCFRGERIKSAPIKRAIPDCSGNVLWIHRLICYGKFYLSTDC
jgi:hypothetical protein